MLPVRADGAGSIVLYAEVFCTLSSNDSVMCGLGRGVLRRGIETKKPAARAGFSGSLRHPEML